VPKDAGRNADDSCGSASARYLPGERSDELYARWRSTDGTSWYLQDRMFSVRDITDASGTPIDHIEYDQFGQIVSESNPSAGDRYKFTGREYDAATGLGSKRHVTATVGTVALLEPSG